MTSPIKEMKSFGYTNIMQVAHRDDCEPSCATLFIAKFGKNWRFVIGCDVQKNVSGSTGKTYSSKTEIKFDAYKFAMSQWDFKPEHMSDWVVEINDQFDRIYEEVKAKVMEDIKSGRIASA
ncbi:hypothetical protein ACTG16_22465 [Aeromonas sp. 23P]|uniref:hypothetical protein n=1 Tax=Aeromonas sp. 23P TaxID=3452716 RepID=UPI003F79A1B4